MRWQGHMHRKGNEQGKVLIHQSSEKVQGKEATLPESQLASWHSKNCGNNESDTFS
jgi:hypothetical protein